MENKNYSFRIAWSDEDRGFIATCPELPGLSAFGETEDQALAEAKIAKSLFIKDIIESGELLPEPQTVQTYSGQTRLRLPKSLHRLAAELAQQDDVSLNTYIADALRARISGEQLGARVLNEVRQLLAQTQTVAVSAIAIEDRRVRSVGRTQTTLTDQTTIYAATEGKRGN
jgi:predicted RNase H-like HicB family nuclease